MRVRRTPAFKRDEREASGDLCGGRSANLVKKSENGGEMAGEGIQLAIEMVWVLGLLFRAQESFIISEMILSCCVRKR